MSAKKGARESPGSGRTFPRESAKLIVIARVAGASPIVVPVIVIRVAAPKLVDLHEVTVVVDVDVVAYTAFAGAEAIRLARSLDINVVVAETAKFVFGLR